MSRSVNKNPYRQSRRFDFTCRCHGRCPYCYNNRMYGRTKRLQAAQEQMAEYYMIGRNKSEVMFIKNMEGY
jgi:hypothetical protein